MTDHKKATRSAVEKYIARQEPKPPKTRRKNEKPELKLTQEPCLKWLRENGFRAKINESKYKYNYEVGKWLAAGIRKGTPDLNATDQYGHSCWIECKAPGKIATINKNLAQRRFLEFEIKHGAFACVVDSVERLETIYNNWIDLRMDGFFRLAKDYLMNMLPKQRVDNGPLFKETD